MSSAILPSDQRIMSLKQQRDLAIKPKVVLSRSELEIIKASPKESRPKTLRIDVFGFAPETELPDGYIPAPEGKANTFILAD
ncbi:MAG: hypothetical protein [Bacteriophage sp.]|nr:MAG: hypothetical protein [Bacteriophage sp.]